MLDDIGKAMYKKLKKESDELARIRGAIECSRQLIIAYNQQWLYFEDEDLEDDADAAYRQKHRAELELQKLQRDEKASLERIARYVKPKT